LEIQVRLVFATMGKIALGGLVLVAFAALAIVAVHFGLRLGADSLLSTAPSPETPLPSTATATPAEIIAARFPSMDADPKPAAFAMSLVIPDAQDAPFDLNAVAGLAATEPPWPAGEESPPAAGPPEAQESQAPTAAHRAMARSRNVLNDAQIASIKQRLKLTAEQERLWPPVEAALRKIVYTKTAMNPGRFQAGASTAYIDPASPEVHELKSAAVPLLMRLNDEQKREVKMLAYVMGLEAVASQF
jgi:hypothetical protein